MNLYVLCDTATGYVLKSEPFTGKSGNNRLTILAFMILRLLSRYRKNHTVYKDHTSPTLCDFMWGKNAQSVGMCMSNQLQLPQTVVKKKLKKMNSFS